ncbi:Tachykinin-like peptide receptor 99D, partial [Orchesella cincta]
MEDEDDNILSGYLYDPVNDSTVISLSSTPTSLHSEVDKGRGGQHLLFPFQMTNATHSSHYQSFLRELHKYNLSAEEIEMLYNEDGKNMTMMGDYSSGSVDELYNVPLSIIVLLSLLYGGISVAALIGNMLVLWVVTISRRMRTVTNMFIANLALADIIIGLFAIPFQFQAALLQRWNLPDFMCAFCPFVQVLSVNVSVFTLSAIAVDRYRAVMYPLKARASKKKATWAILSIWSLGVFLAFPTELDYKVIYIPDRNGFDAKPFCTNLGLSSTFRMYYNLSLVVIQYFFPLIILSVGYTLMAKKLWGTTAPGNKEESRDAVVLRNKKKVIKMLALVVLLFAVCWFPLQTYYFSSTLIPSINQYQYINIIWFSFHWLAMSNSCCNPFIYAIYNDKFQREFRARLRFLKVFGGKYDDSICSEATDFDKSKIRASYKFTNNRCCSPHLHSSLSVNDYHRGNGSNSQTNGIKPKHYRCNNNNHRSHHHHQHRHNGSHHHQQLHNYHDIQSRVQTHPPLPQRELFSVLENGVVRTTSSPRNIPGTIPDLEQGESGLQRCETSCSNEKVDAQKEKFCYSAFQFVHGLLGLAIVVSMLIKKENDIMRQKEREAENTTSQEKIS